MTQRRAFALVAAACLMAPAAAGAKGGVIFDEYPDVQALGAPMRFTVMLGPGREGHPLVTFRNRKTSEVVRVRASRADLNGIAYGSVALPSRGPWRTSVNIGGRPLFFEGDSEPFRVAVGLTQTIASLDEQRGRAHADPAPVRSADRSPPWLLMTSAAAIGAALLVAAMRRHRRWGAA